MVLSASLAGAQPANVRLASNAQGPAAVAALGSHLPEVARAYGLDAQALAMLFRVQPSLGVDVSGALLYVCAGMAVDPADAYLVQNGDTTSLALAAAGSASSTTDAFKLHSLPGALRVIYLDFDGHTTSGTSWNTSYTGGAPIISEPFSLDGDSGTFSTTERDFIRRVWQRVAEDFAPFAVDVTTEDPGIEALRRIDASDLAYGMRVVISPTNWYGSAGGLAYVGSFNRNSDTPCFVFTGNLGNGEKAIAECCSHETGHTLGLRHDGVSGTSPTEYYHGHGDWAPIMGTAYYCAVSQWSKGEYAFANNLQDDLAVMPTYGATLMADDHGNTLSTASVLNGPEVADGGTIETSVDVDMFKFDTGAGTISLTIKGPSVSPNLDIRADLLDASGQVLQSSNPSGLEASLVATVAAGTYYLRIDGVGTGDPLNTGYSEYASIGNYVITGTIVATGGLQAPVAIVAASTTSGTAPLNVNFSGASSTDADGSIVSYRWDFGNGATAEGIAPSCSYTAPGTFVAVLTVTDNNGLASTASVTINVAAPANALPVARASATPVTGTAPLPVAFSSAGSSDSDGSIVSYAWTFGDGSSSTSPAPTKTYGTPGTYTARLTVTDNQGGTSSSTVTLSVLADPMKDVDVAAFSLASSAPANNGKTAVATLLLLDRAGVPAAGVNVTIQWSGLVSGTSSGVTGADGRLTLNSSRTKKSGTITATITKVTPPGGSAYDASLYDTPLVSSIRF